MATTQDLEKIGSLIKGIRFAMMTTVGENGELHSRPMAHQDAEFIGTIWFFTSHSSGKVCAIEKDQHVNLAYADPDSNTWVSISGRAQEVNDRAKMKELWNPMLKTWFPKGLEDPDMTLIKVEALSAEYWDSPSSALVHVYGLAKAIITGERPDPGDHDKVSIQH